MNEKKQDTITQGFESVGTLLLQLGVGLGKAIREAFYGYMNDAMPFQQLAVVSTAISLIWFFQTDVILLRLIHSAFPRFQLNPAVGILRLIFWALSTASPFIMWGWRRKNVIDALLLYLQEAFVAAGLESNGKYPNLIREYTTANGSRVLQLLSDGVVVDRYIEKKLVLENKLGIEIENIRQHRQYSKIIEIEFATGAFTEKFSLTKFDDFPNLAFPIGKTRTETIIGDLNKIPHYLVAGMTGKGKSSFIKTLITVLLANNKNLEVSFVDLKGTEAPIFEKHPRVKTALDESEALVVIQSANRIIQERKTLFREQGATDINSFNLKVPDAKKVPRFLLVVDEIAQLTPKLAVHDREKVKEASLLLNKIARLGRSYGVHLVIGVQKPDSNNLDTTIKANAEGVLCFSVQDQIQSRVVLDNNRAMELGGIVGRAVWQTGSDEKIVQTPFLSNEQILKFLEKEKKNGKNNNGPIAESSGGAGGSQVHKTNSEDGRAWQELNK